MSNDLQAPGLSQEWIARLADAAKEQASTEKPTGNFFSTKSGVLSWNGMALPNNKMEVIAIAALHENVLYAQKYSAAQSASPVCYAYSLTGTDMAPHADAEKPQTPKCKDCLHLKWGSADNSIGKACREVRRLSLLPASAAASPDAAMAATSGFLRVPITSVKNWVGYVNKLAAQQVPTFAAVCEVALVPDAKSMFAVTFTPVRQITDTGVLGALVQRVELEKVALQVPYARRIDQTNAAAPGVAATAPLFRTPTPVQQPAAATPAPPAAVFGGTPPPVKF